MPTEPALIADLLDAHRAGRVAGHPNVLVRLHPKRKFDDFEALSRDPRYADLPVAWTLAGDPVAKKHDLWCPLDQEVRRLTNTVHHGDVNVNLFSTMMLDFAVVDTPCVLLGFTGDREPFDYQRYEHFKTVLDLEPHRIAHTFDELITHLNTYLNDPSCDAANRAKLAQRFGGQHLGRGWERLYEELRQEM